LVARVAAQLKDIVNPSDRLLVGLSGGVDSVVLLDGLQRVARVAAGLGARAHVE